ncbi:hypothetical protein KZ869_03665, partial [Pseudomonas aeruginosa]
MKQIAFIGLGHMGAPMATNLLKAGYLLNVFDLVQSACLLYTSPSQRDP